MLERLSANRHKCCSNFLGINPMNRKNKILFILSFMFIWLFNAEIALSQCTISTTPVVFGNYDFFSSTPLDTTGTVNVSCSASVLTARITLGASSNSGTFNPRKMKQSGGNDLLNYNIYTNVSRTTILGDGTGGTSIIQLQRPPGRPRPWTGNATMFGRIPPAQDVSAGSYSEILTVSVTP